MAFEVIMPKAGIDMTEGQIVKWLKKEGDPVQEGEIILEIMTDTQLVHLRRGDTQRVDNGFVG